MKRVVIIGAGGHGKVVADIIQRAGDQVVGFLDDNLEVPDLFAGFPVMGTVEHYREYISLEFVIAIGNAVIRERIANQLRGVSWYTAIHPMAVVSEIGVGIGAGTVVMAGAIINAGTMIGQHCIINSGAVVEHDNVLEDYVHVSVGAKLAGTVYVGKASWMGVGACVSNNQSICAGCMIGAGAVVVESIKKAGTYVGVPAKMLLCPDK